MLIQTLFINNNNNNKEDVEKKGKISGKNLKK